MIAATKFSSQYGDIILAYFEFVLSCVVLIGKLAAQKFHYMNVTSCSLFTAAPDVTIVGQVSDNRSINLVSYM